MRGPENTHTIKSNHARQRGTSGATVMRKVPPTKPALKIEDARSSFVELREHGCPPIVARLRGLVNTLGGLTRALRLRLSLYNTSCENLGSLGTSQKYCTDVAPFKRVAL